MKFKHNLSLKPIIQLTSGSILAQLITVLVSPISTRLFSQAELGTYTLILTVVSMFGPILCLRYDMSIVTAKNNQSEYSLIRGGFLIGIVMSTLVTLGYTYYLNRKIEISNLSLILVCIMLFVLLIMTAITNILTAYNNKHKEYGLISKVYVTRNLVQNAFLIGAGIIKSGYLGLLFSQMISLFVGVKKQSKRLTEHKEELKKVSKDEIIATLKKEKKQVVYSTPASLVNASSYSILNFFISGLFGLEVFGLYSMSYRILGLPLTLISGNISKIFFQVASDEYNTKKSYRSVLKHYTILLLFISVPMVLLLYFFAPLLFEFVFGVGWRQAGVYVKILAPMYGIRLIVSSLSVALIISNKQQLDLILQVLFIVCSIASYSICKILGYDEIIFFKSISFFYSIIYIIFYCFIFSISERDESSD